MNYELLCDCHCGRSVAETRNPLKGIVIPRLTRDPWMYQGMAGQARHDNLNS